MQYVTPIPGFSKTLIVARRENELKHAIKQRADSKQLKQRAERLRQAHLQLLRALMSAARPLKTPTQADVEHLQKLKSGADHWTRRTVESIIAEFAETR